MELKPVTATAKAPAANFTGDVHVNQVVRGEEPSRLGVGLVRFTPGARSNWHHHAVGQALYCTDGIGLVVNRDGTVIRIRPGDTVWTPAGEQIWSWIKTPEGFVLYLHAESCGVPGDGRALLIQEFGLVPEFVPLAVRSLERPRQSACRLRFQIVRGCEAALRHSGGVRPTWPNLHSYAGRRHRQGDVPARGVTRRA